MNQYEIQKAQRIIYLVTGYRKDSISAAEREELDTWRNLNPANRDLFIELNSADQKEKALNSMNAYAVDASFDKLKKRIEEEDERHLRKHRYSWITAAAAAAVLILVSIGIYFYNLQEGRKAVDSLIMAREIAPGFNKATLTLADGEKVELTGDKLSVVLKANELTYNDGEKTITEGKVKNQFAVLTTPRGGQYQVVLSDGTKVWLNAASSLKYPSRFEEGKREVQLTGEAYFEVATRYIGRTKKMPFIVKTATQQVAVLGTHFNINNYPDEAAAKTTLMEGAVMVSVIPEQDGAAGKRHTAAGSKVLKPGQQSIITKDNKSIKVVKVDPAASIDWKNGDFIFDADIKTIMRQISRWYNVGITYEGTVTNEELVGTISRSKNLMEVLKVLQETNKVHFRIEEAGHGHSERKVIVMP